MNASHTIHALSLMCTGLIWLGMLLSPFTANAQGSFGFGAAQEVDQPVMHISSDADNPYRIVRHESERSTPKEVLLLYSVADTEDGAGQLKKINTLAEIITSHWNSAITLKPFQSVSPSEAAAYQYVLFVETQQSALAAAYYGRLIDEVEGKTMLIGCGSDWLFPGDGEIITGETVNTVTYKNVAFAVDEHFVWCGAPLPESESFTPLGTYTTTAGTEHDLMGIYRERHVIVPFLIPGYYQTNSYSLPFLDVFHHFLGHHDTADTVKPALLRLEDVNVHTYASGHTLRRVDRYLREAEIPYHIAFIVRYIHPEAGIDMLADASKRFLYTISQMVTERDNVLIQHGYTHQVGNEISGAGYEFWDAQQNAPLQFADSETAHRYPIERIDAAQAATEAVGLHVPEIWETPHYAASPIDHEAFDARYPLRYEHIPGVGSLPFIAEIGDTIYIPENLGYIFTGSDQFPEKQVLLQQLETFEDPVASVFWHPWRDRSELETLTTMIIDAGFTFVTAYSLLYKTEPGDALPPTVSGAGIKASNTVVNLIFISFILGALLYARNIWRVRKYITQIRSFSLSLDELYTAAAERNTPLPTIGLFIPARNEGLVIGNTLKRIAGLAYPKSKLRVFVIVDERELDDDVPRTTKAVAFETIEVLKRTYSEDFISVIEVPRWYSGTYGSYQHTYAKSTKGRALNYCLQMMNVSSVDMIGVLDADGRLDTNVLKEVAYKRITTGATVLQGPVFQVSNFKDVSLVGKMAGLELALHHLTELPHKLQQKDRLQFLAGTNYFIDPEAMQRVGGWNQHALVEDAEIALRLYIADGTVGEWLNAPEIEQTPASFAVYRKQRERWVRGHIDLLSHIRGSSLSRLEKLGLYNKILFSQARVLFDVGLPIIAVTLMITGAFGYLSPLFSYLSVFLLIASIGIWDTYGLMYRTLIDYIAPNTPWYWRWFMSLRFLTFLPAFIIIQAIPRVEAIYNYCFRRDQVSWYKTERTPEVAL